MDDTKALLKKALQLKPQDRFLLIDGLIRSLDEPDKAIAAPTTGRTEVDRGRTS